MLTASQASCRIGKQCDGYGDPISWMIGTQQTISEKLIEAIAYCSTQDRDSLGFDHADSRRSCKEAQFRSNVVPEVVLDGIQLGECISRANILDSLK
jgi:hypothetical protein